MNLNEAITKTKQVADKMPPPKWGAHQRFVELVEEVGELANAIQTQEGYKTRKRKKSEVVNSVCDCLYELLLVAEIYDIDLEKEYPEVLKEIDGRRKKGEFDH
jgi:NTP pyrophosphatase (non-canonical NTP hydrolase)